MKKLFILLTMLIVGIGSSWAKDYVVTVTTTTVDPLTNGTFATDASTSGYYTTWTSNASSGVKGLIISTSGSLGIKSQYVNGTTYGTVLALKTTTTGGTTAENFTITAPTGYYIKGYNLEAKRYSSTSDNYTIQSIGGKTYTSIGTTTSTTFSEAAPYASSVTLKVTDTKNMSTNYLCFVGLTVTLTDALPGTRLNSTADGVTWNNENKPKNWNNTWTSGTSITPTVTIKCGSSVGANDRGNMQSGSNVAGSFYLHTNYSPYYTISVPYGYIIKKYTIVGAGTDNFTFTNSEGDMSGNVSKNMMTEIIVNGCNKNVVSFKVSPGGHALDDATIFLDIASFGDLTINDLSNLSNTKAYNIMNARGTWNFADNATAMSALGTSSVTDLSEASRSIAIIYYDKTDNSDDTDGNYYLFSVNAGKYLTANNTLTSMPTDAEQVDIVATGNTSYPWFFRFKTVNGEGKYTNNINISAGLIKIDGWGPNGSNASGCFDDGNRNVVIEVSDFDPTVALAMFTTRTVTYNLSYGGNSKFDTETNVTVRTGGDPAEFVPSRFENPFVNFSDYSPATITSETTEVTVTATWNGPFNIAPAYNAATQNIWYVLDMHSNENNYTWQYDSESGEIRTPVIAKDAYASLTDNNLWCFVGNPWDGFKIYNKAAGNTMTIRKGSTGNTVSYMSTTDDHNQFKLYNSNGAITNSYCFKLDGDDYYLNKQNMKLQGWNDNGAGSSCRFFAPGSYHLAAMASWNLNAPLGAVGTKTYITTEDQRTSMLAAQTNITNDPFCVVGQFSIMNTILNPINSSDFITLSNGYYRVVSAVPGFNQTAAWYYNPSNDATHITWAKAATTSEQQVNSIFKFESSGDNWNIKSPNAQKYLIYDNTAFGEQTGTIGDDPGTVYVSAIGSAQHTLKINVQTIHANGHQSGSGTSGTLINWNSNNPGEASTWYIVKVEDVDISLNNGGDGNCYATLCLPFDVTISNANAYTLEKSESGNYLVPTEVTDNKVPAGTPVLLKGTNATATATINTGSAFGSPLDCALKGTYVATTINTTIGSGNYVFGKKDSNVGFYHVNNENCSLKANRAYLSLGKDFDTSVGCRIMFDDVVTGIVAPIGETEEGTVIYNLSGQRLNKIQKGINIVNGKKVLF